MVLKVEILMFLHNYTKNIITYNKNCHCKKCPRRFLQWKGRTLEGYLNKLEPSQKAALSFVQHNIHLFNNTLFLIPNNSNIFDHLMNVSANIFQNPQCTADTSLANMKQWSLNWHEGNILVILQATHPLYLMNISDTFIFFEIPRIGLTY